MAVESKLNGRFRYALSKSEWKHKQQTMSMMKTLGTQIMAASVIHKNSVHMFCFSLSLFPLQTQKSHRTCHKHPAHCIVHTELVFHSNSQHAFESTSRLHKKSRTHLPQVIGQRSTIVPNAIQGITSSKKIRSSNRSTTLN